MQIKCGNLRNWRDPGQQTPCKGRPAALASSPFPRSAAQREKGEGAQRLRGGVPYFKLMVVLTPWCSVLSSNQRAVTVLVCV